MSNAHLPRHAFRYPRSIRVGRHRVQPNLFRGVSAVVAAAALVAGLLAAVLAIAPTAGADSTSVSDFYKNAPTIEELPGPVGADALKPRTATPRSHIETAAPAGDATMCKNAPKDDLRFQLCKPLAAPAPDKGDDKGKSTDGDATMCKAAPKDDHRFQLCKALPAPAPASDDATDRFTEGESAGLGAVGVGVLVLGLLGFALSRKRRGLSDEA